jgi:hypothetical protein
VVGRNSRESVAWRLGPAGKTARSVRGNARGPRVWWHDGALDGGAVGAGRQQGVAGEHRWGPGVAPGKEEGAGAHRNGGSTARRRKRRRAAMFIGGRVAPVVIDVCGWVLQLKADPRVRRRRSIEGRSSSEGRSPEGGGADGGDARTESGAEEGLRWRKTGEVDAWAMRTKPRHADVDG